MLPLSVSNYLPHVGLLLILIGIVVAVVTTNDATSSNNILSQSKFTHLAYVLIIAGGFILVGPFH